MNRRGGRKRQAIAYRIVTLVSLLALAAAFVMPHAVGAADDNPYTTISPQTQPASDIHGLYKLIFWGALIVFIGVQVGVAYTALRYRRRSDNDPLPPQTHGNKTVEIIWTIIPAVILLVIFIPTVKVMYDTEAQANDGEESGYVVEVYGKQWWWEVHYAQPENVAGVITANDIYVPVNTPITFKLYSNNVIHSFWVPRLSGKMDVMPGHENVMGFTVPEPGVYYGECAEFCGDSHAYMRFKIIAVDQASFDSYVVGLKSTGSSDTAALTGDITKSPKSFGICLGCHRSTGAADGTGAPAGLAPLNAQGTPTSGFDMRTAGPNLANYACRTTIGAGMMPNDEEHLRQWLKDPGSIKQGNYMATVIKPGTLTDAQIDEIVAYLMSLKPEGGCPALSGSNADTVVQLDPGPAGGAAPAATPEATPAS